MSNYAALTNSFQHMGLAEQQINYHELQLEYPVLDLLPVEEVITPLLRPPAYSGYREKPDTSAYHLPISGTDFLIRLSITNEKPLMFSNKLFSKLTELLTAPGRSLLQFVTYSDPEDGDHFRFRLLTERNSEFEIVAECELNGIEWEAERSSLRREAWMRLISHLLGRISARAYLHVHERLKNYRWYTKQVAEERWDYKAPFNVKQFLAAHLRLVVGACWEGLYDQAVHEHDFEGEGEATFLFPCGHKQDMDVQYLRSLSIAECIELECQHCGNRLAQRGKGWRLQLLLHRQRERRAHFSARELVWQRIGAEFPVGNQKVSVESAVLRRALQHALISTRSPESASPVALCMTSSADFVKILEGHRAQLLDHFVVDCASDSLLEGFLGQFDKAAGQVTRSGREVGNIQCLPPAWVAMVQLWLTRATQLAGIPGYDGRDPVAVSETQTGDNEDGDYGEADLDELEEMMRDARLE